MVSEGTRIQNTFLFYIKYARSVMSSVSELKPCRCRRLVSDSPWSGERGIGIVFAFGERSHHGATHSDSSIAVVDLLDSGSIVADGHIGRCCVEPLFIRPEYIWEIFTTVSSVGSIYSVSPFICYHIIYRMV